MRAFLSTKGNVNKGIRRTLTNHPVNFFAFNNEGTSSPAFYQTFTTLALLDGVYGPGGSIEKTKVWSVQGGFEHNWSPTWQSSVFGSYTNVDYNGNASTIICNATAAFYAAGSTCNPDFNIWQVGTRTAWTPVRNLTFSGEVMYTMLDQSNTGGTTVQAAGAAGSFKPAGAYEFKDQGMWSGQFRVRRTW